MKWTERWSLAGPIGDEEATRIVRHFLPEDDPSLIVVRVPVDDAAAFEP